MSLRRTLPPVAGTATSWERLSPSLQLWKRYHMSWFRRSSSWLDSSATVAGASSVTPRGQAPVGNARGRRFDASSARMTIPSTFETARKRGCALWIAAESLSRDPSEDQRDHVHAQPEAGFDDVPGG